MLKKFFKAYSKKIVHYTIKFLKWSLLSVITGLVVGGLSTFFAFCMNTATEYAHQQGDKEVYRFDFTPHDGSLGYGADWHPSMRQHEKMANELTPFLKKLMNW